MWSIGVLLEPRITERGFVAGDIGLPIHGSEFKEVECACGHFARQRGRACLPSCSLPVEGFLDRHCCKAGRGVPTGIVLAIWPRWTFTRPLQIGLWKNCCRWHQMPRRGSRRHVRSLEWNWIGLVFLSRRSRNLNKSSRRRHWLTLNCVSSTHERAIRCGKCSGSFSRLHFLFWGRSSAAGSASM